MDAAGPFDPEQSLAPTVDRKANQKVAQEVRVQNTGVIDGDHRFHDGSRGLSRWLFLIKARVLRQVSDFVRRAAGLVKHFLSVGQHRFAGDTSVRPDHPASQLPALDEFDHKGPRYVQKLGGLGRRHLFGHMCSPSFAHPKQEMVSLHFWH
jgi:hypothetical protein